MTKKIIIVEELKIHIIQDGKSTHNEQLVQANASGETRHLKKITSQGCEMILCNTRKQVPLILCSLSGFC
jgi:hypothetical protein